MSEAAKAPRHWRDRYDEVAALAARAQNGDETALPGLREVLDDPEAVGAMGDLARLAQRALVRKLSGKKLLFREAVARKMELMRAELLGESPAPLERLLVDRVVACWLHLHHLELLHAGQESMSLELGAYYQRCLSSAQRRYLAAVKALALVRKLALPALQVNIARRQVNVAGACPVAADSPE